MKADEFRARMGELCGYGWQSDLSEAIGISGPRLSDQINEDRLQGYLVAALEFLEALPIKSWPPRWAKLAERAKKHAKKERKAA